MANESDHENAGIRQSENDKFILKLDEHIDRNMENEHFGVGELAEAMNLSRMQVYRRVRKITGMNVSQYIREKRLNVALEMLRHNEYTVSEIAYKVGFGSVSYFSNCFRKRYGYPPGQASEMADNEEQENIQLTSASAGGIKRRIKLGVVFTTLILIILASGGYLTFHKVFATKEKDPASNADINREKSIAVMPFTNDSPDQENEYFCNGVVDEIFTHLLKITDLNVISRTNAEQYRNRTINTGTVRTELGVSYILTGSVRKIDDDIRITAQLIDVNTGHHLWAETYDGKYTSELFSFQSDVAKKVASSLQAVITPAEEKKIDRKPTTEIIAYDLYMQGIYLIGDFSATRDKKYLDSAHKILDRAIAIDQKYERPLHGKGHAFSMNNQFDSALIYAGKILDLNPETPLGYALKGGVYDRMGKKHLAFEYISKSIELGNKEPWPFFFLGELYCLTKNDYVNGLPLVYKGIQLRALDMHNIYNWTGRIFLHMGDYDRASKYLKSSLEIRPTCSGNTLNYFRTLSSQGKFRELIHFTDSIFEVIDCKSEYSRRKFFIYFYRNEYEEAQSAYNQFVTDGGQLRMIDSTYLAFVYDKLGMEVKAMNIIKNLISSYEPKLTDDSPWFHYHNLASAKCLLEEKEDALHYLSKAVDIGLQIGTHDFLEIDPTFETLRDDTEFKAIVQRAQEKKAELRAQVRELLEKGEIDL
jgi:TolB-like protein/AraC-like DNA-binding protein